MNNLSNISRRAFSKLICSVTIAPFVGITGCNASSASSPVGAKSPLATKPWVSGGTDLITVDFPDDSIFDLSQPCNVALSKRTTLGPCYFKDDTGEDISLGLTGLPMQLCLRLVDSNCEPLENYTIEIWHCDTRGVYSADTSESSDASDFAGGFCTGGDAAANKSSWYRGKLTTDNNGRVNFKTNFPGWYSGRTIHFHYAISDASGQRRLISQFCVTDELAYEICTTHPLYADRGEQDRPLAGGRDSVFPGSGYEAFFLNTRQNSDGTLLAYQTIKIR